MLTILLILQAAEEQAAHLAQVAEAVELFAEYEGRLPAGLGELAERPSDAAFWPGDGFLAGGAVPEGITYEPESDQARLRAGDRTLTAWRVPERIDVPADRARWHEARIRVRLVAAAARAYRDANGRLPARLGELRYPIAGGLFESPEGATLELLQEGNTAWFRLDPSRPSRADPAVADRVRDILPRLRAETFEERERATQDLVALGSGALPAIAEALRGESDPEVQTRLAYARDQLQAQADPSRSTPEAFVIRLPESNIAANQRSIAGNMMSIANGQETGSNTLFSGNYWAQDLFGLYALQRWQGTDMGLPARFITNLQAIQADIRPTRNSPAYATQPPAVPQPLNGYFFVAFPVNETLTEGTGPSYGICAFPAEYGVTGRLTYIVDEEATVYQRDLRGRPVDHWPTSPEKGGFWEVARH